MLCTFHMHKICKNAIFNHHYTNTIFTMSTKTHFVYRLTSQGIYIERCKCLRVLVQQRNIIVWFWYCHVNLWNPHLSPWPRRHASSVGRLPDQYTLKQWKRLVCTMCGMILRLLVTVQPDPAWHRNNGCHKNKVLISHAYCTTRDCIDAIRARKQSHHPSPVIFSWWTFTLCVRIPLPLHRRHSTNW